MIRVVMRLGNTAEDGGALHASDICRVNISGCVIEENTASFTGGGISSEANVNLTMFNSSLTSKNAYIFSCFIVMYIQEAMHNLEGAYTLALIAHLCCWNLRLLTMVLLSEAACICELAMRGFQTPYSETVKHNGREALSSCFLSQTFRPRILFS